MKKLSKLKAVKKEKKEKLMVVSPNSVTIAIPHFTFKNEIAGPMINIEFIWARRAYRAVINKSAPDWVFCKELERIVNEALIDGLKNGNVFTVNKN